jgi:phosphoglycolate phosphatase-like HAD superfamily hydrolase
MPLPFLSCHRRALLVALSGAVLGVSTRRGLAEIDPLPSWNNGPTKAAIIGFVKKTTTLGSKDFAPLHERIAVFDNDGTLWCEQPYYFELAFAFDRIAAMAPQHPEWKTEQPFKALLEKDMKALAATGKKGLLQIVMTTHAGMTTDEFRKLVLDWTATARHPRFKMRYTELIYQPMVELLAFMRANGFKTYIVSGGGVEFMRPWTGKAYGIPPEQVVGSSGVTQFVMQPDGKPILEKLAKIEFVDDGPGKPAGINRFIGRHPLLAFGNSDGDKEMLEWTAARPGTRFMGLVHHTDAAREYAYDRKSSTGRLDKALDEAMARHWTIVDMKADWKRVFAFG